MSVVSASGKLRVAVLAGGPSSEAAVSRTSARAVSQALLQGGYGVEVFELDAKLPLALGQFQPDVAFPVTHGPLGEDGCLQGLLEVLGLPYVGSGVLASALAADKPQAKRAMAALAVPLARGQRIDTRGVGAQELQAVRQELGGAVVVKPASGGSAIGVARVPREASLAELERGVAQASAVDAVVLMEQWVSGLEVTCGVFEDERGARALPPTLIHANAADWYDFKSRYAPGGSRHECPAPFSDELVCSIQATAVLAHQALGARDLSRVDFVVGPPASVTVLEVNTLPGMTATSLYPEAAAIAGLAFVELCAGFVERAAKRAPRQEPAVLAMPE